MMQRMRELAVQAVNDTNDNAQRSYLDLEFQQLKQQIVQIADNTEWNGFALLSGKAGEQVGEMPVYKATSNNLAGQVFIDPMTSRTLEGAGVGEQQTVTFTLPSALTAPRTITVGGVDVTIDSSITTSADLASHIKSVLDQSTQFGATSGRSVAIDPNSSDSLIVTFAAAEGDDSQQDVGLTAGLDDLQLVLHVRDKLEQAFEKRHPTLVQDLYQCLQLDEIQPLPN
jgi:flagellin